MTSDGKVCDNGLIVSSVFALGAGIPLTTFGLPVKLGLYVNNVPITKTTVLADLTEATFSGYARVSPVFAASDPVMDSPGMDAVTTFQVYNFHNTGGTSTTVYGYFATIRTIAFVDGLWTGTLFSTPVTIPAGGTLQVIVPIMLLNSEF